MESMFQLLIGLGLGVLITYYTITHYNHFRTLFSDILRGLGFLGKWVRKKSVESKYEGIINGAVDDFNSNFEDKIISNCKIKWIDKDTEESYFDDNTAIICLKFDKKDHDLNFYNATYSFTKTALLPKTRNFVKSISQKAIDLNLTKIFIKDYNRKALRIFNQKYQTEQQNVRDSFIKFEETEKRGLFSALLIPELHYLGETLATSTPSEKIESEIENFFDWFHELATRGKDERTILNYRSEHIKVGVILVANMDTYSAYGIEAYTKWADKYASEHYGAVYLLARGKNRASILREVVSELTNNKGFDQINKKVTLFEVDEHGEKTEVTCYCLKPNLSKIQYNSWEKIKSAFNKSKRISCIVNAVNDNGIIVNIHGVDFEIPKKKLSVKELPNISRYFHPEQELLLNIESFDEQHGIVEFNNIETETDPNILIESTLKENKEILVEIISIQFDREGKERGLKTYCKTINRKVYIPRRYCSYSRFLRLESTFNKGDELSVVLHGFSMEFANFYGEISGLENPLVHIQDYQENHKYDAIVQEITENYLTTEILPGLECRIFHSELSWDNSNKTQDYNIGDKIEIIVIKNDPEYKRLTGSVKRVQKSEKEEFFKENASSVLKAKIINVYKGFGVKIRLIESSFIGFVYARELMWGFCSDIEKSFPVDSFINVKPIYFDYHNNEVNYSIKACFKNDYDEIIDELIIGETYSGIVIRHFPDLARIELSINGSKLQGYIHKSQISNIAFIENGDIEKFLPLEKSFRFILKRRDERNKMVELSRKSFLYENTIDLDYGDVIEVEIVKLDKPCAYFYENEIEGKITENFKGLTVGSDVEVFLINKDGEFGV